MVAERKINCKRLLNGLESGIVWKGRLINLLRREFWILEGVRCGMKNGSHAPEDYENPDPNDMILCKECLVRGGYIW